MTTVATAAALEPVVADFQTKLDSLDQALGQGPYFNGADFSLVDATYAPPFLRLDNLTPTWAT